MQLQKAWEQANGLDDALSAQLPIAFDQDMGYLTACPTNVGTGLRASVMVHLPALALKGSLNQMLQTLSKLGLSVRGMYGEGSAAAGNIFQISNQVTLGKSEQEIIEHLSQVVEQVICLLYTSAASVSTAGPARYYLSSRSPGGHGIACGR